MTKHCCVQDTVGTQRIVAVCVYLYTDIDIKSSPEDMFIFIEGTVM